MQQSHMLEHAPSAIADSKVPYQVRLARPSEFEKIFRMRYEIFFNEMGAQSKKAAVTKMDQDQYDELCDHLVVVQGHEIIGTYRLLPLRRLARPLGSPLLEPYSQSEFDLNPIRQIYGDDHILELGRSCIHAEHRTGQTARMLWAGIAKYLLENNIKALIGCVSVHGISDPQAARLSHTFKQKGFWDSRFDLAVQPEYSLDQSCDSTDFEALTLVPQDPTKLLPPLMKGYVNLGAKICGGPAFDEEFHCHDYLMLLDYSEISPRYFNALVKPLVVKGMVGNMHSIQI